MFWLHNTWYVGKATRMLLIRTFWSKRSFLLKKTIKGISEKNSLLTISSKRLRLSCIRLTHLSSTSIWSYSDMATTNRTQSTLSKQCIHFLRSERWPPTSNMWKTRLLYSNSICKYRIIILIEKNSSNWMKFFTASAECKQIFTIFSTFCEI